MVKYQLQNILGMHILDNNFHIVQSSSSPKIAERFKDAVLVPQKHMLRAMALFSGRKYFPAFREKNIALTMQDLVSSLTDDVRIGQAISALDDLKRAISMLSKRVQEWYGWYHPAERFPEQQLVRLAKEVKDPALVSLAAQLGSLQQEQQILDEHTERLMKRLCPNVTAVAGHLIGAKLLQKAGSLRRLASFPSSTIQLLGAEEALFRHLKTRSRSPKYGYLHEHRLVAQARRDMKGKAARALADKLAIAAKVDYFKGSFVGDKLSRSLARRFS